MNKVIFYSLLLSLFINIVMFIVAFRSQSDKLTDISYAISFAAIAVFAFMTTSNTPLHFIASFMVVVWSVRLGSFLLYRIHKKGKDTRFDVMRKNFFAFGRFWLFQAITVWVLMLPVLLLSQSNGQLTLLGGIGLAVWFAGLLIESFADMQKFRFAQNKQNKGKWIETGLWYYSRHPNYFGEILVWIGVYVFSLQVLVVPSALIAMISPLLIMILLVGVSGIPILEKSADARWGRQKSYREYKRRTSLLIPFIKR